MITIATTTLTTTFLIAIRTGILFLFTPIEAIRRLPIHVRLLLVLVISLLIVANISGSQKLALNSTPPPTSRDLFAGSSSGVDYGLRGQAAERRQIDAMFKASKSPDNITIVLSALAEVCNGLILSIGLFAAFGVFQIAGQLIDTQMGLNSIAIFNPTTQASEPLTARILSMLAVLFFFALDGHHKLLEGLVLSFAMIEPGQLKLFSGYKPVIQQCSLMFTLATMVASPIVICLLIIELSGGILTRNMPQMNTYFLILPIKMIVGLLMLGLLINQLKPLMDTIFYAYFQSLNRLIT